MGRPPPWWSIRHSTVHPDWYWVRQVKDAKDITHEIRRKTAGLGQAWACAHPQARWAQSHNARKEGREFEFTYPWYKNADYDLETWEEVRESIDPNRFPCIDRFCNHSARCYNNLGFEKWLEEDAKEKYIEDNAGEELRFREGPAGLRNYGATCYANAFLQLWYNNVAFRNGVYEAAGDQGALHTLASVFGHLQLSRRSVVDPGPLIEALRLNKGDQQDAAEFSKLFMTLLSDEFARRNPESNIVKDLFEGEMEYCTRCDTCGYESRTEAPFLELEISLKDKSSLESRIDHLLQPERLEGDNKYSCPSCGFKLQPATRSTLLKKLPPFLHFSLMRFVYDPRKGSRKKSKQTISYPRKLRFSDNWYELIGVVTHEGSSAFHGHFTCEVYDEDSKEFYFYSDEHVERVEDKEARPTKRIKLETNGNSESSRDAYMLVYRKMGSPAAIPRDPPQAVLDAIEADNALLASEIEERLRENSNLVSQFEPVKKEKLAVLKDIAGDDCLIPRDDLKNWAESPELTTSWKGFERILCEHRQANPTKMKGVKLVSRAAFERIKQYNPDIPDIDVCASCVEAEHARITRKADKAEQLKTFKDLNNVPRGESDCLISEAWLREWRKKDGISVPPTDPEYSLLCEHGRLWVPNMGRVAKVAPGAVAMLQSIYGHFPTYTASDPQCDECAAEVAQKKSDRDDRRARAADWRARTAAEKKLLRNHMNITQALETDNYLIPRKFFAAWDAYLRGKSSEEPESLDMELCPHGLLDFDPQMEDANYLTEAGWRELCEMYSHDPSDAVTVQFTAYTKEGKKFAVDKVSKATCDECQRKRLLDFEELWLPIVQGRKTVPVENLGKRRSSSRSKQMWVEVQKDTPIKEVRLHIYETWKVSPLSQRLFLKDREVDASETIESLQIAQGDYLCLEEVEEADDFGQDGGSEGFGGTALIGRTACPACTYSNEPMHLQCAMCGTQL